MMERSTYEGKQMQRQREYEKSMGRMTKSK